MHKLTTRFSPTTDGWLHPGHIYLALVNQAEARRSSGKFILRLDDSQEIWSLRHGPFMAAQISIDTQEDMRRFGIIPDEIVSQVAGMEEMNKMLHQLNGGDFPYHDLIWSDNSPDVVGDDIAYCAYNPHMIAEKVVFDFLEGITLLIRGEDLITEFSLYSHLCNQWRIPQPRHVYLPRLMTTSGEMRKSEGGLSIRELLSAGYSTDDIMAALREACLLDKTRGWYIDNIKAQPVLGDMR